MLVQQRLAAVLAFGVVVLASSLPAKATATVSLALPSQSPVVGELFEIQIVADLSDAVVGWGLDFSIADDLVATVTQVEIDSAWIAVATVDGDGLAGVAFPDSISGTEVILATITLEALAEGTTQLWLSDENPADVSEGFALDPTGFDSVVYKPASLTVVPEPATLTVLGWAVLVLLRRHRR